MIGRNVLTLVLCAVAVSACNGPASLSSSGAIPQGSQGSGRIGGAAQASPIPYIFNTVDNPASLVTAVTGINQQGELVGTVGAGTTSDPIESYSATPPYTSFTPLIYAGAQGTVAMGVSSSPSHPVVLGYVIKPASLRGTWAAVLRDGIWSVFKNNKEGIGDNSITELLGSNDSQSAAGYYVDTTGKQIAVVVNVQIEKFNKLKPPGAINAQATGINDLNHVAGWESTAGGLVGFFYDAGVYYRVAYPSATATEALGLNQQDQIVGYYQVSGGIKHGFVMTGPTGQQAWQAVDDPNGVNGTVVTGINATGVICGYYIDGIGIQHGFVGTPTS